MKKKSKRADKAYYTKSVVEAFNAVAVDYEPGRDIFDEDTERVAALKRIIADLPLVDRNIMLLYCELQSTEALGKILHVSKRTAARKVAAIRAAVIDRYNQLNQLK